MKYGKRIYLALSLALLLTSGVNHAAHCAGETTQDVIANLKIHRKEVETKIEKLRQSIGDRPPDVSNTDATALWLGKSMATVMEFGFADFDDRKVTNRRYFTEAGYTDFYDGLNSSGIREMVIKNRQVLQLKLRCMPHLVGTHEDEGARATEYKVPVILDFQHEHMLREDDVVVRVTVIDSADPANQEKLGIHKWLIFPAASEPDMPVCSKQDEIKAEVLNQEREKDLTDEIIQKNEERLRQEKLKQ